MSAAWDAAREQAQGAALLASAEASWLGEDAATAADLRALAEALRLREVAADHLLVIRARLDGEERYGYIPAHLGEATTNYLITSGEVREVIQRLVERWADDKEETQ